MQLLSIDIETTGLDPNTCSVLEIGAVVFDPCPLIAVGGRVNASGRRWQTFNRLIRHTRIQGEPYELAMNSDIISELAETKDTHIPIEYAPAAIDQLASFLTDLRVGDEKFTIVGKNYDAFDARFLENIPGWNHKIKPLCERRTLDVGSLCFDPSHGRVQPLDECLAVLGIRDQVAQRTLGVALQVATVVSRFFAP